ncbi:MAG: GNAT family N-acetyltransferase [Proteobacteria bacterium]|nr:GNAT family N-acetyltransferase [Pseudomonadota bacterium]
MTIHSRDAAFDAKSYSPPPIRHNISDLNLEQLSRRFVIFTPSGKTLEDLVSLGREGIGDVASVSIVRRAVSHNPDNLWAAARRSRFDASNPVAEGFFAFLMLNAEGMRHLSEGRFNGANPDFSLLSLQNERPAGIYAWAVYAPKGLAAALPLVMEKISTPLYKHVDMFTNAATEAGARFFEAIGLRRGATVNGRHLPNLFWLDRTGVSSSPPYDTYRASQAPDRIGIAVARSIEDLLRVFAVRSAVYVAEQRCPYEEEFDGNDFCATHLLGYVGDEPAGCMRIRCFADFAKVERVAIRQEFRHTRLAQRLVRASIALCRDKGYRRLYGHPRSDLLRFYNHFGFHTFEGAKNFQFSGVEYTEVVMDLDRQPNAVAIGANPYIMIRPEGRWHQPGILERSARRNGSAPPAVP